MDCQPPVIKFVNHSKTVLDIAVKAGWCPGASYTNLRDLRSFQSVGFLDIDWKDYDFSAHVQAAKKVRPFMTVARDVEDAAELDTILAQAEQLAQYSEFIIVVPKDKVMADTLGSDIPPEYLLGYSVPTKYGGTLIEPDKFKRPVHLLGGRPDVQRKLADQMPVVSFDCNRFTLDASFGDYFDGETFRPHPKGGYRRCLKDSIENINAMWASYTPSRESHEWWNQIT